MDQTTDAVELQREKTSSSGKDSGYASASSNEESDEKKRPQIRAHTSSQSSLSMTTSLSEEQLEQAWKANSSVPEKVDALVHDLIFSDKTPSDTAVCAHDGELTYEDLDSLSTVLSRRLIDLGVSPEEVVPLCFEKSKWMPVAMLGVMKAGGASLALDTTQPEDRLQKTVENLHPGMILCSSKCSELARSLYPGILTVPVGEQSLTSQSIPQKYSLPDYAQQVQPSNALYVVSNSGKAGKPEGVVITHSNFSSALKHQTQQLGFGNKTRTLEAASYGSDAVWYNTLHTLFAGDCVCIASEEESKNDINSSIKRLQPTFARLTANIAKTLDDSSLEKLDMIELVGEAPDVQQIDRMRQKTSVRFAYGPAACSSLSTLTAEDALPSNVGSGVGTGVWVVDAEDADSLVAPGSVGELCIEGPPVSRGFYNNDEKTAASFIEDPTWLTQGAPGVSGRSGRLYRTGELARQEGESLVFVGRKEPEIKSDSQQDESEATVNNAGERRLKSTRLDKYIEAFDLLEGDDSKARRTAAELCGLSFDEVEDIFPCTPRQVDLIRATANNAESHAVRQSLELKSNVHLGDFKVAWGRLIRAEPILRTRIVDLESEGLVQVLVNKPSEWSVGEPERSAAPVMGMGTPLTSFGLNEDRTSGKVFFSWTMHPAVCDTWSIPLLLDQLEIAYARKALQPSKQFQAFVRQVQDRDDSKASEFWQRTLDGAEGASFPSLPSSDYQPKSNQEVEHDVRDISWPEGETTPSTLIQTAWALLTTHHTACNDVVFGSTISGKEANVPGIEQMTGPTSTIIPVRTIVDPEESVSGLLSRMQRQSSDATEHSQIGLQQIRQVSDDAKKACDFQSMIVIRDADKQADKKSSVFSDGQRKSKSGLKDSNPYGLLLDCQLEEGGVRLRTIFDSELIEIEYAWRMLRQVEHVLRQLVSNAGQTESSKLADIEVASENDVQDILEWNGKVPQPLESAVHDLVAECTRRRPDTVAVCGHDGKLTYGELDDLSSRLAYHLAVLDIGPDTVVPLSFEKSIWVPVSMLAVLKVGGSFTMLPPSLPKECLTAMLQKVAARVVLAFTENAHLFPDQMIICPKDAVEKENKGSEQKHHKSVSPSTTAAVTFNSDSKAVMLHHRALATAAFYLGRDSGADTSTRVFQHASYSSDTSIHETFMAFIYGSCLCIASNAAIRTDLAGAMTDMEANWACLAPSVTDKLEPEKTATLKTLVLSGEKVTPSYITKWTDRLWMFNLYSVAEAPVSSITKIDPVRWSDGVIGSGSAARCWIISRDNANFLAPIGAIGELVTEGSTLMKGYLNDDDKTSAALLRNPQWFVQEKEGAESTGRLFKTGDLVRYDSEGSIAYVGRKDSQIKELSKEDQLTKIERDAPKEPERKDSGNANVEEKNEVSPTLSGNDSTEQSSKEDEPSGSDVGPAQEDKLAEQSSKNEGAPEPDVSAPPVPQDDKLAEQESEKQEAPKPDVSTPPAPQDDKTIGPNGGKNETPEPFSLLIEAKLTKDDIASNMAAPAEPILDAYPVTQFQAACLDGAVRSPPQQWHHFYVDLPNGYDLEKATDLCKTLWDHIEALRTSFIQCKEQYLQVLSSHRRPIITHHSSSWETSRELTSRIARQDSQRPGKLGTPFCRFFILSGVLGSTRLALRLSQAQYDGATLSYLMRTLKAIHEKQEMPEAPKYSAYLKYRSDNTEPAKAHWTKLLKNSSLTQMKKPQNHNRRPGLVAESRELYMPHSFSEYTPATIFTAASAHFLGYMSMCRDVTFGRVVSGRGMLPEHLADVSGACMNVVPVRVRCSNSRSKNLQCVHDQHVNGIDYEFLDFDKIVEDCTDWPEDNRSFGCISHFQEPGGPAEEIGGAIRTLHTHRTGDRDVPERDTLMIYGTPEKEGMLTVEMIANGKFYTQRQVEQWVDEFGICLRQFDRK